MSSLRKAWNLYNLMKSQWKSNKELKSLQEKRLRSIIKYSYEEIPLFNSKCKKACIRPEDIKTVEDLVKVPFTTKAEIQANFPHGVVARHVDLSKCWKPRTSGSTGIPLTMVYDEIAEDFEKAVLLRANLTCGQKLWDKWCTVDSPHYIKDKKWFQSLGLFNQVIISMFKTLEEQKAILEKIKPDILDGCSSALYLLAKSIKGTKIHPRIMFGTSDSLSYEMRRIIDSTFGVKIFDQFGCVEMGRTAWECPEHSGHHIDLEAVVMEFISEGEQVSPGERGEIVYTNLYNYAMPLIRYRIGDIGIPTDEKCPCGRTLPLIKTLEGRNDSFIKTPDGRILPQMTFWTIITMFPERDRIAEFKVTQVRIDRILFEIVPQGKFPPETIALLERSVRNVMGDNVEVDIDIVKEIPRDKSGKIRSVVSKLKTDSIR